MPLSLDNFPGAELMNMLKHKNMVKGQKRLRNLGLMCHVFQKGNKCPIGCVPKVMSLF